MLILYPHTSKHDHIKYTLMFVFKFKNNFGIPYTAHMVSKLSNNQHCFEIGISEYCKN